MTLKDVLSPLNSAFCLLGKAQRSPQQAEAKEIGESSLRPDDVGPEPASSEGHSLCVFVHHRIFRGPVDRIPSVLISTFVRSRWLNLLLTRLR